MKSAYDKRVRKRSVNLSLNQDLVAKARGLTENLSAEVEGLLAEFVARQMRVRSVEADSLRRTATAWDDFAERHGSFAESAKRAESVIASWGRRIRKNALTFA